MTAAFGASEDRRVVDIASLVCFRVAYGALMIVELGRYTHYEWIRAAWVAPAFHFTYYGFGWVRPWPGPGMTCTCSRGDARPPRSAQGVSGSFPL